MEIRLNLLPPVNDCSNLKQTSGKNEASSLKSGSLSQITELRAYHAPTIYFRGSLKRREEDALPPELKKDVDNIQATFVKEGYLSSEEFKGTVKEFIEFCFYNKKNYTSADVHHATSQENANSILENGFDLDKLGDIKTGPGVYFSDNAAWCKRMCGNTVVSAHVQGYFRPIYSEFFNAICNNEEFNKQLDEVLKKNETKMDKRSVVIKYVRQLMADEFELDGVSTTISGNWARHYVVFNPNSIGSIYRDEEAARAHMPSYEFY